MLTTAVLLSLAADPNPGPNPDWDADWPARESWCLSDHVQLTSETDFFKAGESYFSPDGQMIIFQGTPRPTGDATPDKHYGMYIAPVARDMNGSIAALSDPVLISEPGSANTCGWFHPDSNAESGYTVLFGTTTTPPDDDAASGYQRGTSRYSWQFPNEMEIVVEELSMPDLGQSDATPMWTRDGYDAEASWSPDGRHVLYTRLEPGSNDGDLWIYDSITDAHRPLVTEVGYDGGPFFSPDGTRICYRSDRRSDKLLQLFIADLAFDEAGSVTGIKRETAITDNKHVNWCPFFTPDGSMMFYATSEVSHGNYEVYAIDATGYAEPDQRARVRITDARGFDGLPVFTPDGEWMMWTAQRGEMVEGETRPSSQLWAARVDLDAVRARLQREAERIQDEAFETGFDEYVPEGP